MKIAVFGRNYQTAYRNEIQILLDFVKEQNGYLLIFDPYFQQLKHDFNLNKYCRSFGNEKLHSNDADLLVSLGGDGTLLESVSYILDSTIPVMGINMGRLGFLSSLPRKNLRMALDSFFSKQYTLSERSLLKVDTQDNIFGENPFALNEICIHKKDTASMITIHTFVDNQLLNSYWADGLIISTPTGSTAYSMSCGGPIVSPYSKSIVITPIAPHNLTVRPVILPDNCSISLKCEGRTDKFILSADSRSVDVSPNETIRISKASQTVNFVVLQDDNYFRIIREKLMWGQDFRNNNL